MRDIRVITECECHDVDHMMAFCLFPAWRGEAPELYISVQLNPRYPWWKRLWVAGYYILGRRSRFGFGHWDSGTIGLEGAKKLLPVLGEFIAAHNSQTTYTASSGEQPWPRC